MLIDTKKREVMTSLFFYADENLLQRIVIL